MPHHVLSIKCMLTSYGFAQQEQHFWQRQTPDMLCICLLHVAVQELLGRGEATQSRQTTQFDSAAVLLYNRPI